MSEDVCRPDDSLTKLFVKLHDDHLNDVYSDTAMCGAFEKCVELEQFTSLCRESGVVPEFCAGCNLPKHARNTMAVYYGAQAVCQGCLETHYVWCERCETYVLRADDAHEHSDDFIKKYRDYNKVWAWNEDPMGVCGGRFYRSSRDRGRGKPRFFGIELEVERDNEHPVPPDVVARSICSFRNQRFIMAKHDGSLSPAPGQSKNGTNGFELVTMPATLRYHKFEAGWQNFYESVGQYMQVKPDTAGLHVHVGRAGISELTVAKVVCFINSRTNYSFLKDVADRDFNAVNPVKMKVYAATNPEHSEESRDVWARRSIIHMVRSRKHEPHCWHRRKNKAYLGYYGNAPRVDDNGVFIISTIDPPKWQGKIPCYCKPGNYDLNRYSALNIATKKDTFEFRIFRASSSLTHMFSSVEFCDALINFCDLRPIAELTADNFVGYLQDKRKQYPYLVKWLVGCGWMQERTKK